MGNEFFDEQLPGSKIKSQIVESYFWKWAKVMIHRVKPFGKKIGYLDFFCGPGKYDDDSISTPLLILKAAVNNPDMAEMLVSVFNDKDPDNVEKLKAEVLQMEGFEKLKHKPTFMKNIVGNEIVEELKKVELVPSLIFIDPCGYKGLSLDLIASVIKDWGCDCIFFFNYNRINAAINNPVMETNVKAIFGDETLEYLRTKTKKLNPDQREKLLLETFTSELKKVKGDYSISFKFYSEDGSKTSHFIFFVSKHPLAYSLMKQTMADNCDTRGAVPTYEYNPMAVVRSSQTTLFGDDNFEILKLADNLVDLYKGKTMTRKQIYEGHHIDKPYIENNYKEALLILEQNGKVITNPPFEKRRKYQGKPTLGENVILTFKN
jgi:three-Cys-motif partner protein